jgi:DNA-binding LacI/PurR family transcriptional regulator
MENDRLDNKEHIRRRPTSYDVARLAGVSQSAVSRCFRPGNSISDEKRKVILRAAAKLGYEPNVFASSLITKRSNLVAVLISNLTNLYYPQVLAELTQRLDAQGIRVLLFALQNEGDAGKVLSQIWRYRVDGAIAGRPAFPSNSSRSSSGIRSRWCSTTAWRERRGAERLLRLAGRRAAAGGHLVAAGHRRFLILSVPRTAMWAISA